MHAPTHLAPLQEEARALRERGDLVRARTLLANAVATGGTTYGNDHPDVLTTARMLAALQRETGELTAARRTLEEALTGGQLSLAENDPLMLLLTYDLGLVADELGNRHEARRNLSLVARLGPASLGEEHAAVQTAACHLTAETPTTQPPAEPFHLPTPGPSQAPNAPLAPNAAPSPPPAAGVPPPLLPPPSSPLPAPPLPPPRYPTAAVSRPRRTPLVVAILVAVATVAGLTMAVLGSPRRAGPAGEEAPAATSAAPAARPGPTDVRLLDQGTSITLAWRDPSAGGLPFIVAGGRAGEQSRPLATLPPGRTSYTLSGLNPRLEYCFTVVAVYSTEDFTTSNLVCTRRAGGNPQPTRS